ncbi:T-cell activation mitochondrial [Micractinium conductrix]|uniref:T-cell activation mitochondrial n=1 Tax=Micractinium conductrix TaxID=554055 RepID=A0A2P6V473_9CHLO|nr:T-cell activation mitochondrial [Micractinium conductrix]|eukprot:PSC68893.1 T-cell activation mitochondrial [Micractinium conductrix]
MQQLEEALTGEVLPADVLAANHKAMAELKAFVANLSPQYGWPPSHAKQVQFVVRNPFAGGRLQRVRMLLKTTGGNCAPMVQQTLGQLLQQAGLPPYFYWDGDQFRNRAPPRTRPEAKPRTQAKAAPPTPADVQATRAKAAAAGFPSQTITEEQFKQMEAQSQKGRDEKAATSAATDELAAKIKKLDPLFSAVAALPWLSRMPDADMRQRVRMIRTKVMDELESEGWDVRGPVRRIWDGERNLEVLQQGKDAGSRDAIKSVLFHVVLYDRKHARRYLHACGWQPEA